MSLICHETTHYDENGKTVIQIHIDYGLPPDGFVRFFAMGIVNMETPFGPVQNPFRVPISASTIAEAFDHFDEAMKTHAHEAAQKVAEEFKRQLMEKHEAQRNKIITPDQMPPPSLPDFPKKRM